MNIGILIGLFSLIITCISFGIQIGSNIQMKTIAISLASINDRFRKCI